MSKHNVDSKLEIVRADVLREVIAEGERRIGIQWAIGNIAGVFGKVILAAREHNSGHFAAEAVVINSNWWESGGALPRPNQTRGDVVGGVAGNELIQQSRRSRRCDSSHHAYARPVEVGLNSGKSGAVSPQGHRIILVPRIVDVTKCGPDFIVDVVIDAEEFFPPGCWEGGRKIPTVGTDIRGPDEALNGSATRAVRRRQLLVRKVAWCRPVQSLAWATRECSRSRRAICRPR